VFAWGSSDLVAPADVLNPLDLRGGGFLAGQSAKLPVPAVEAVLGAGPLTLRGVVQPFFTPSRFFLVGWDFALLEGGAALALPDLEGLLSRASIDHHADLLLLTRRPADRLDAVTLGGRATLALDDLELSLTAIHGWDVLPRVVLDRDLVTLLGAFAGSPGGPGLFDDPEVVAALVRVQDAVEQGRTLLSGEYRRRTLLGLDAAWALDPVVLKLDVAGTLSRTLYTRELEPLALPWINAVVGLEYARGEDLQVLVEGFAVTVPGVPANERLLYLEGDLPPPSAQNDGQRTVVLPGAAAAVRAAWLEGDLRAELLAAVTFTRRDLVLMPRLSWRYARDRLLGVGALIVEGDGGGYGAANDTADQVFVSWRISS
jgi:hypothetical protein